MRAKSTQPSKPVEEPLTQALSGITLLGSDNIGTLLVLHRPTPIICERHLDPPTRRRGPRLQAYASKLLTRPQKCGKGNRAVFGLLNARGMAALVGHSQISVTLNASVGEATTSPEHGKKDGRRDKEIKLYDWYH